MRKLSGVWGLCSCFSFLFCIDVYVVLYQDYLLLHFSLCFYVVVCGPVVSKLLFMLRSVTPRVVFLTFYLPWLRGSNSLVSPIMCKPYYGLELRVVIWRRQGNCWINIDVRYRSICLISEIYKGRPFSFHNADSSK